MSGGMWEWGPNRRRGGLVGRTLDWLWLTTLCWSITIEGEINWWCRDDDHHRTRKLDYELRVPRWPWRLYCWWAGRHSESYGSCVFCETPILDSPYYRHKVARRAA